MISIFWFCHALERFPDAERDWISRLLEVFEVFERLKSFLVAFTQTEYLVILYNFVRMNGLDVPVKSFYYFREIINNIEKYKTICIKKNAV